MLRMRILYVVTSWRQPTETFVRREVSEACRAGNDVVILSLRRPHASHPDDPPVIRLSPLRAGVAFLGAMVAAPRLVATIARTVLAGTRPSTVLAHAAGMGLALGARGRIGRVDFVHAHFAWVAATAAWTISLVDTIPFGVMVHAFDVYKHDVVDDHLRRKLAAADLVGAESERIAADVEELHGRRPAVVRIGVPSAFLRRRPVAPLGTGPVRVLSVGSLVPKKGHDVLLRALAMQHDVPMRLTVAGDGPQHAELTSLAHQLGVDEQVSFVGAVDNERIPELLDGSDIFVLASRVSATGDRDGVPNVLIEAMARMVPVISTAVGGIPDLLSDDRGLVTAPDEPDELAGAMRQTAGDYPAATGRAQRAFDHVAEHYVAEENWARLERLIATARADR